MHNYDFPKLLSDIDFELLSKDLLEEELGIQLENFKGGKDKGIDHRYAPEKGKNVIVQCKRYSEYSKLRHNLKKSELPKIHELNPDKYILTTSVPLSPPQVDEIKSILSPFIKAPGDIFGKDRLNKLLDKHSEIERRHIKLWVGSKGVLESILHADTYIVTREEVERAIASAKLYVRNDSFDEALSILNDQHVCIISGSPGIGKTTLAQMLLLYFQRKKFDIIKIESNISEARKVGYHDKSRFYYYDDFLGQTRLVGELEKNEDQKLIDFMRSVRNSKDFFVLTTREYILNQAKLNYEKIDREDFEPKTCLLDLAKYSRANKAHILYNHLYFSKLPGAYLECLIDDGRYIRIIDHKNYNPRVIESMTSLDWIKEIRPQEYPKKFIDALDNPRELWEHAFDNQISDRAQNLLVTLTTFSKDVIKDDLEKAFWNFHKKQCTEFGIAGRPQDFKNSLKELEGTFVEIQAIDNTKIVSLKNGSVRDFMESILMEDQWLERSVNALVFFEQAYWVFETLLEWNEDSADDNTSPMHRSIADALKRLIDADSCAFEFSPAESKILKSGGNPAFRFAYIAKVTSAWNSKIDADFVTSGIDKLADELESSTLSCWDCYDPVKRFNSFGYLKTEAGKRFVSCLKAALMRRLFDLFDFGLLAKIIVVLSSSFTESELKGICDQFKNFVEKYVEDYDYESRIDAEAIRFEATTIGDIGKALKIDVSLYQEILHKSAERVEKVTDEKPLFIPEQDIPIKEESISDTDIQSMFSTLISN